MTLIEYNSEVKKLAKIYAEANNLFKIGDIIKDHEGDIIEITNWVVSINYDEPTLLYQGIALTRQLKPYKISKFKGIWQCPSNKKIINDRKNS